MRTVNKKRARTNGKLLSTVDAVASCNKKNNIRRAFRSFIKKKKPIRNNNDNKTPMDFLKKKKY